MKKMLALALTLIMVLSLAACGGGKTETPPKTEEPAKTETPAPSGTADPGETAEGELYDIPDEQIGTSERDANYSYKKGRGRKAG